MAPLAARTPLTLLSLAALNMQYAHSLPSWLQLPFLRVQHDGTLPTSDSDMENGPEAPLLHQLKDIDVSKEPERARTLHSSIAKIIRASGGEISRAVHHLEEARNAAKQSEDPNTKLDALLELADLYIESGRPSDAHRELAPTLRLLNHDNFWEYSVKLDHTKGRASFEDGSIQLALEFFEEASRVAVEPEDIVRSAIDIAKAHLCLGRAQLSLQPLKTTLDALETSHDSDTVTQEIYGALATEVHSRLAETFHAMGDKVSAQTHYRKASILQQKWLSPSAQQNSAIKTSIKNLENGSGPELRCPGGSKRQSFKLGPKQDAHEAMKAEVASLLAANENKKAEFKLWHYLETLPQPHKSVEAAATLNSLGNFYTLPGRKSYYKASQCFMKALNAALSCCGVHSEEAKAAFSSLKYYKDELPHEEQTKADAILQEYLEAAAKLQTSASDLGQREMIIGV